MLNLIETIFSSSLSIIITAVFFLYTFTSFVSQHLKSDTKDNVTLWLMGAYEARWHQQYLRIFDGIYGEKHFSLRCFGASCLTSLLSVSALGTAYIFLNSGGIGDYFYIALLCIFINFIPDYISLLQTRFLLQQLQKSKNILTSFLLLILDLIASLAIISAYLIAVFAFNPGLILNILDGEGAYFVSIFVFSTLVTSVFSWLYFLSTALLRLFHGFLNQYLDIEYRPLQAIALVAAVIFVAIAVPLNLVVTAVGSDLSLETSFSAVRNQIEGAGFTPVEGSQLTSVVVAFLFFVWLSHSAFMQTSSSFLLNRREASWLIKSQAIFSIVAILVVATKIGIPTIWGTTFPSQQTADSILARYLIPSGLPKWQIASAINGVINLYFWHRAAMHRTVEPLSASSGVDHLSALRLICAILSAYSICALTYISLTIEWVLPPICDGFFPWSQTASTCI